MSRRRLPRRPCGAALGSAAAIILILSTPVIAETASNGGPGSHTVFGRTDYSRCSRLAQSGDATEAAIETCTRAITDGHLLGSSMVVARINRGVMEMRRSEHQAALDDFNAALAIDPDHAEALLNRGAVLVQLGQAGQAVAALTRALSLGVQQPHKAYYNRGAAREALGDMRGAYEDYNSALAIEPEWGPAEQEIERFVRDRRDRLASAVGAAAQ